MKPEMKKLIIANLPYLLFVYLFGKLGQTYRLAAGADLSEKLLHLADGFSLAFESAAPSFHLFDLAVGVAGAVALRLMVYCKSKNAKKYRRGVEYGSARWGSPKDIAPYIDPVFDNNILLTQTERLTMNNRPKDPKTARNKNVLVIGGSGSGKTRFFVKPNLMQCVSKDYPTSFVITDPKGSLIGEVGQLLVRCGYPEQMQMLRKAVKEAPEELWSASLYAGWLYTLNPLLVEKGAGYPSFMTTEQWKKKALETYAGSFTELKHDTVLYAKQVMAEMGGGPPEELDDRGYVEPEEEVYRRFAELAEQTADGLQTYGILDPADRENLTRLASLARSLETISRKELQNERLSDEEYDLIREYGGTLEHFWIEAVKDRTDAEYLDAREIPASLVTDIATDPNGTVLQAANGRPAQIYVIVPVDGTLRIASGVVYNFYQFRQPLSARLTDTEWRQMTGEWMSPDGRFHQDETPEKPWWTQSYWVQG